MENASKHYSLAEVKRMIEKRRRKNDWEFIFLGANIDAIETARTMGIAENRAANFVCDSVGTALNYGTISEQVIAPMRCGVAIFRRLEGAHRSRFRRAGITAASMGESNNNRKPIA